MKEFWNTLNELEICYGCIWWCTTYDSKYFKPRNDLIWTNLDLAFIAHGNDICNLTTLYVDG
jgi:hypothetical protein